MDDPALDDPQDDDVVAQALEPFGALEDHHPHDTSAMIAEATAAAIASATTSVDVVAVDAAALAAESAANLVDAAGVPVVSMHASSSDRKNEQRRKRYRERLLAAEEADVYQHSSAASYEDEGEASTRSPRGEGGDRTTGANHEEAPTDQSASRRARDRERYASMTQEERDAYNARRRKEYTKQSTAIRQRRRQRERNRYHNLPEDKMKERNAKRARLERERYKKMSREVLEERNRKRRERAAAARRKKMAEVAEEASLTCAAIEFHGTTNHREEDETEKDSVTSIEFHADTEGNGTTTDNEELLDAARGLTPQQLSQIHQHFPAQATAGGGADETNGTLGENSLQDIWKDPTDL